ncbi:Intradiol ring-cleavage dioxygenase [Ilyonectria robusta]|uniref:Intradiol ring-cleavage dioxygenase n=1 Tax=Ilyonectria robusta TaxID=1079257 RepID=UPI001E8D15FF|nr:Intradiol ring-cleavage dioxygenase [Ilyonectria robusta]KAH8714695.1 Intradiol ring-cleavage dioxygenase [Ilyonectria robusta]
MKFTSFTLAAIASLGVVAHPERLTAEIAKREANLVGRTSNKCAAVIEKRREAMLAKRASRLHARRAESGHVSARSEHKYTTIQNDTCVLAPDTIFGPYGVDGEIVRTDLRESQKGIDFYFDIGVIDVETCDPLEGTALTIWNCNATGSYSSFTGIDPDTSELLDGWSKRTDGTTDDETFLRGIQITDSEGMIEFITKFPGYYVTRTTHIHVTAQTNITNGTSYSASKVQHVGQLFFDEDLLNSVYALSPYVEHLATLNRTTNAEDKLYSSASSDGYSAVISVSQLGDSLEDGLVGYITIGVNTTADAIAVTGDSVNPQGWLPTVSVDSTKFAEATSNSKKIRANRN